MAISAVHYTLLKEHAPLLKRGGSLLEVGEANWYGDWSLDSVYNELEHCEREHWHHRQAVDLRLGHVNPEARSFEIAKAIYYTLFAPSAIDSVDMHGTSTAFRQDLNGPLRLRCQYDVCINHGTAEHIFNIGMVFKSMHDAVKVGGIMIHESPFTGWIDHGFYCLQPGLFYDLAAANEYELISLSIAEIVSRTIIRVESREHLHTMT